MAKNVMRKVSNSVSKVVSDTKKMSPINLAILVVSVAIVVVLVILLVKRRKREGFALLNLLDSNWVAKGEDGVKGEDGPQGPQGLQGPPGENYVYTQEEKDELYSDFRNKIMKKMVDDKIVVKEGNEGEEKYFPVGTINMNTFLDYTQKFIKFEEAKTSVFFKIKYNKLASNSYVKITYVLPMTGWELHRAPLFKLYVNDNNNAKVISASTIPPGPWPHDGWDQRVLVDTTIIGIDTTDEVGEREYAVGILIDKDLKNTEIKINGIYRKNEHQQDRFNNNYCASSCTIEEIVVPDKSKISGDSAKRENINFLGRGFG